MGTDNLLIACQEADKYNGILLRDSDKGEFWHCVGVLIAADDLYYEVIRVSDRYRLLLSFVGDLEKSWGYVPVINRP